MWGKFWFLGLVTLVFLPEFPGEMDISKFDIKCHSQFRSKLTERVVGSCHYSMDSAYYHNKGCMDACLMEALGIVTPNFKDPSELYSIENMGLQIFAAFTEDYEDFVPLKPQDESVLKNVTKVASLIHKHCAGKDVGLKHEVECKLWDPLTKCVIDVFNCVLK